jgi:hypothetical protein
VRLDVFCSLMETHDFPLVASWLLVLKQDLLARLLAVR